MERGYKYNKNNKKKKTVWENTKFVAVTGSMLLLMKEKYEALDVLSIFEFWHSIEIEFVVYTAIHYSRQHKLG